MQFESRNITETLALGRRLAGLVRPSDVIALRGSLGVGKTAFTGGLAEGLGVLEPVVSPTFVLMRRYDEGFIPLTHVDAYRLGSLGEFDDLDAFEEASGGVLVIEWGDAVASMLPRDHLLVSITSTDESGRLIEFVPSGSWTDRPLQELSI